MDGFEMTPIDTIRGLFISTKGVVDPEPTPDEFDQCPACGTEFPLGYLDPDGICDDCLDDIEGLENDGD